MVLAQQPKRRTTVHHKKRTGQHQKQTKHYMKTYWPYLPIIAAGFIANIILEISMSGTATTTTASLAVPTRLDVWTNANSVLTIVIVALIVGAAGLFITRHARAWQRVVVKGEDFFMHHRTLDLLLLTVVVAGIVATRTLS